MYRDTAEVYDKMNSVIDYPAYAGYFIELLNRYKVINTHSLLETGCGSGNLTRLLASAGYDMTGVDSSAEMLSEAYTKEGPGILWINQDVRELDLFGTYDAAVSFLDFPNHLTDPADLRRYFSLIENYLNPGGLCIFDINSEYKFRKILSDNVFYYDDDDYSCIWQNSYHEESRICSMEITLFRREGKLFRRSDTSNLERAYSGEEIIKCLESSGLSLVEIFGDMNFEKPTETEERIFFICRKEYNE